MSGELNSLGVRPIEAGDKGTWLELWNGYLDFYETDLTEDQTQLTWSRLLDPEFNMEGFVIDSENGIFGFAHYLFLPSTWTPVDYCYLEDLYVKEGARGAGAGRSLIDAVIAAARAKSSGRVYWTTQENNARARVLYDSYTPVSNFVQYRLPQTY